MLSSYLVDEIEVLSRSVCVYLRSLVFMLSLAREADMNLSYS